MREFVPSHDSRERPATTPWLPRLHMLLHKIPTHIHLVGICSYPKHVSTGQYYKFEKIPLSSIPQHTIAVWFDVWFSCRSFVPHWIHKGNLPRDPCPYSCITQTDKKQIIFKMLPLDRVLLCLLDWLLSDPNQRWYGQWKQRSNAHAGSRIALVLSILHLLAERLSFPSTRKAICHILY